MVETGLQGAQDLGIRVPEQDGGPPPQLALLLEQGQEMRQDAGPADGPQGLDGLGLQAAVIGLQGLAQGGHDLGSGRPERREDPGRGATLLAVPLAQERDDLAQPTVHDSSLSWEAPPGAPPRPPKTALYVVFGGVMAGSCYEKPAHGQVWRVSCLLEGT